MRFTDNLQDKRVMRMLSLMDCIDITIIFCCVVALAGWFWHAYDKNFQEKRRLKHNEDIRLKRRYDKCPKCRSEELDFEYEPNTNLIKYECRDCGNKWQLREV
jgi:hypothetical protein